MQGDQSVSEGGHALEGESKATSRDYVAGEIEIMASRRKAGWTRMILERAAAMLRASVTPAEHAALLAERDAMQDSINHYSQRLADLATEVESHFDEHALMEAVKMLKAERDAALAAVEAARREAFEEAAKIAEDNATDEPVETGDSGNERPCTYVDACHHIAAAIRARGTEGGA